MDHPTTTVAARYYRRSRQALEDDMHFLRTTLNQTQAQREASLRALNEVLLANRQRPVTIMRFNGLDCVPYRVQTMWMN